MKIIKLNGEVINIGDWDYKLAPVQSTEKRTKEQILEMKSNGQDPALIYDESGAVVTEITNPLPFRAIEEDQEVVQTADGGLCLAGDHTKLRVYPSIADQLDYIYHNGVEAWKLDIIKPIKDEFPKS